MHLIAPSNEYTSDGTLEECLWDTRRLHVDASILLNAPFRRRLMAFISEDVRLNFVYKCDGLLPLRTIEQLVCNTLPPDTSAEIARFHAQAKTEVGDQGKQWKLGGQRR